MSFAAAAAGFLFIALGWLACVFLTASSVSHIILIRVQAYVPPFKS